MHLGLWRHTLLLLSALISSAAYAEDGTPSTATHVTAPAETSPASADGSLGGDQARTRFLIGLDQPAEFQISLLNNPSRVIIDIANTKLQLPASTGGKPVGLVSDFRAGVFAPGKTRVVIDVTQPVVVHDPKMEKAADGTHHRLSLEFVPAGAPSSTERDKAFPTPPFALGAAGVQPPLPQRAVRPEIRAAKSFKPIIIIDPGHGGQDSGAVKNGAVEKEVVLAFSKTLKKKLEDSGRYKVLMTRETDVFVELGDRVAFAEKNKAALFIAVHADYASTQARGATIYSLRESVATSLEKSAKSKASDNVLSGAEIAKVKSASVDNDIGTVKSILADLATREVDVTRERTDVFTRAVVEKMGTSTRMRDDPDQQSAFRVLKTAQFPSVLIELAYVTNKEDAEQLKSDSWRSKVADSITTAVDSYFTQQIARLPM